MPRFISALLLLVSCLLCGSEMQVSATTTQILSDGSSQIDSETNSQSGSVHMVFTCHGMMGDPSDMVPLLEALKHIDSQHDASHGEHRLFSSTRFHNVQAHEPQSLWQRLTLTTRGVEYGGTAVAHEILRVLQQNPDVTSISLIGFSLGGLYMRVAAGLLLPLHPSTRRPSPSSPTAQADPILRLAQQRSIEFNAFVSIATPHVGVRGLLNPLYSFVMQRGWVGQAGLDLAWHPPQNWNPCTSVPALCSNTTSRHSSISAMTKAPLLLQLASPLGVYWRALAAFRTRTAVGNEVRDDSVPYSTAALAPSPEWMASAAASKLGIRAWEPPAAPHEAAADPHLTGTWIQEGGTAAAHSEEELRNQTIAWANELLAASGGEFVTPEIAQAASLRSMGGWLNVNARWDDWYAYFVNHNRIHGHKWLTPWADCKGFLQGLARIVALRMKA